MRPGLFATALVLATSPVAARAADPPFTVISEEPVPAPSAAPPTAPASTKWYGLPMLYADVVSAVLWGIAAGPGSTPGTASSALGLAVLGGLPYVLTSPIVHALHGHGWRAVGSVVLRAALPAASLVIGALVGAESCTPYGYAGAGVSEDCTMEGLGRGALVGLVVGGIAAAAIDDGLLAWEPPDPPAPAKASLRPPTLQWLPTLGAASDSSHGTVPTFGIAGSF